MADETPPSETGHADRFATYPSLPQALGLLLMALLLQTVVGTAFSVLLGEGDGLIRAPGLWGVLNLLALAPAIYYGWRRAGGRLDVFRLASIPAALIAPIVLCVVGLGILISELDNLTQRLIGSPPEVLDLSWLLAGGARSLAGVVFLLVVVAPVTEELLFRGIILRGLLTRYGPPRAILLTAALFAVFHLNPWQFIGAFVLGAAFGWFYVRFRSVVPCLLGHAIANGLPILAAALAPSIPGFTDASEPVQLQPLWLDLLGLLLAVMGAVWLRNRLPVTPRPPTL